MAHLLIIQCPFCDVSIARENEQVLNRLYEAHLNEHLNGVPLTHP